MKIPYVYIILLVFTIAHCKSTKETIPETYSLQFAVNWAETDANVQISSIADMLSAGDWLQKYVDGNYGKRPTVVVATIRNTSNQLLDTYDLQIDLEKQLQNKGKMTVIGGLAVPDTSRRSPSLPVAEMISIGKSHQSDYVIVSELSGRAAPGVAASTNYVLLVEVFDMVANEKVWVNSRTIRRNEP